MEKIDLLTQTVETDAYELPLEFYLECEAIASTMELTVDHLLDEFFVDGKLDLTDVSWGENK
jgi:hypothetical protein